MLEIESRIEEDIEKLKSNNLNISVSSTRYTSEIYYVELIYPVSIFEKNLTKSDINFLLEFSVLTYPSRPPRLYCLSSFCSPSFSDGRDILENIIQEWKEEMDINIILNSIPLFVKMYIQDVDMWFIGRYYLGSKYDFKLFSQKNYLIKNVKENVSINGKYLKFPKILIISDIYFLLFEQEKWGKNNLILTFWASINSIKSIKKVLINNIILIHFNQRGKKEKIFELNLTNSENDNQIVDFLLENMKKYGMNLNEQSGNNNNNNKDNNNNNEKNNNNNNNNENNNNNNIVLNKKLPFEEIINYNRNNNDNNNNNNNKNIVDIEIDFDKINKKIEELEIERKKEGNEKNKEIIDNLTKLYFDLIKYYEKNDQTKIKSITEKLNEITNM